MNKLFTLGLMVLVLTTTACQSPEEKFQAEVEKRDAGWTETTEAFLEIAGRVRKGWETGGDENASRDLTGHLFKYCQTDWALTTIGGPECSAYKAVAGALK